MRLRVITRVAVLAVLALLAVGAVPARSSSFSVTTHVGVSLRRVWMKPGVPAPRRTSVSGSLNHAGLAASDETDPGTPPDTTGAAGPSNYVEMVNSKLAVYSKTDLSAPTETMSEADFVGAPGDLTCDGNVQWDEQGGRWLYST